MVTAEDFRKAGVSPRTLTNYQRRGLLPAPVRRRHPSGRGVIGYWPDSALNAVRWIKEQQTRGRSLDEIAELHSASQRRDPQTIRAEIVALISDWKRPVTELKISGDSWLKAAASDYRAANGVEPTLVDLLRSMVRLQLCKVTSAEFAKEASLQMTSDAHLAWALELYEAGHVPVLVFNPTIGAKITTDFLIPYEFNPAARSARLADSPTAGWPTNAYVVYPLFDALTAVESGYSSHGFSVLEHRGRTYAVPRIRKTDADAVWEVPFHLVLAPPQSAAGPTYTFSALTDRAELVSVWADESTTVDKSASARKRHNVATRKRPATKADRG